METRVAALEGKVASLKAMIQAMQLKAKENQETLMKMLSARFENVDVKTSTAKMTRKTEFSKPELSGIKNLHGESFDESRQSVKKVELPMCGVSKNEGTTTISEGRPMIRSLREEVQSRGVETRMSSSTATTLKGRVLRERNNGPPPPPPEPPDIGSLATTPVQPESPVVGSFATPNWSLLTTSPSALATEDPFLSKEEERGAVLIFGELGPVVDILGLAHTIWVMGKGGQQAKNGSPSEITKEPLQIEFPPPNLPKTSCVHKFEMYCKNLPLSKDLDPQESMHDEELLSLTGNILVQLLWRTKDVGYWVETTMILGFGLAIRRHVSQYKILLLHLYCHFGALSVAHEWYKSLDVKNILMESILHHILPQILVSPLWTELNSLLKDYLKFMDDHFRESADLTFLAYRHRNYSKVIEFVQFKDRLQHSSQYLVARVETPILQLKQNADNIEEEEGILQSLKCGIHFRELSNEIGSKSLTFNEDLQSRPWWTPTLEKNYLLGPFEGISYCPREILTKERETSLKRVIEKKSLLPRMIYLSIQSASSSIKEHVEINGSVAPDITSELKLLLERFVQFLGFSLSEAIEVVMGFSNGDRSVVSDSNLIDWLNFTVFLNAWSLSSHELVYLDRNGHTPRVWNILDSLLEKYILEKVRSTEPQIFSSWSDIQLVMQLVTEPLAWHGLVIQSCLRSCLPSSKKKKKSGSACQSSSNLAHAITDSVQHLSLVLEDVMKWISEWNRRPEDENLDDILFLLQKDEHNDGPGRVFHILETFTSSINDAKLGDRIYQSLKSWSSADVARKMVTGKRKVLMEFSAICESKLKLLQSVKQQIAQL